ncbi:MAG TPA: choice-of-anchor D domain-containing protein, partial [bacterium]
MSPGQSQYVLIYFLPSIVKTYQDVVTIRSDDPDEQYKYINIQGIGRLLRNQNISLSTRTLAFGEIPITRERTMGLTIYNTGEKELTISNISNKKKVFTVNTRQFAISPESDVTVYVSFTPDSLKSSQDTLKISSNDPDFGLATVVLTGSGRNLTNQKIAVYPDSLYFGAVGVGLTANQNIQIQNEGEKVLNIDSMKLNSKYFSFDGNQSFSIQPGTSNWLSVSFSPDSVGDFPGKLSIYSNDLEVPLYRIPLVGMGRKLQDPNITFYPTSLNFESVAMGRSKTIQLYIGNNGEKDLSVTNIVSNDEEFRVQPTTFVVQPGMNQMVNVIFQPTSEATSNAKLTIMSNDPDSSLAVVPMTGTGRALIEPRLSYSPEALNFGEVVVNKSSTRNITIQNLGDLPLKLFQISTFDTHFVANIDTAVIEGGENINFSVTFTPRDSSNYQSSLQIRSNDPSNSYMLIPLTGKGKSRVQQIVVSPPSLDFKDVRIHNTTLNYLWISNLGSQPLTITNIFSNNSHFVPQL